MTNKDTNTVAKSDPAEMLRAALTVEDGASVNIEEVRALLVLALSEGKAALKLEDAAKLVESLEDADALEFAATEVSFANVAESLNMSALTLFSAAGGSQVKLESNNPRALEVHPAIKRVISLWLKSWELSPNKRSNGDKVTLWTFSGDRNTKMLPPVATMSAWDAVQHIKAYAEQNGYHVGKPRMAKVKGLDTREYISATARDKDGKAVTSPGNKEDAVYFTCYAGVADK